MRHALWIGKRLEDQFARRDEHAADDEVVIFPYRRCNLHQVSSETSRVCLPLSMAPYFLVTTSRSAVEKPKKADIIFKYQDADLLERHGYVPYWLKLMTVCLVIWAVYYLWVY